MTTGPNFKAYQGIIPPMVTPLKDTDTLDIAGIDRLIDHMLNADITGIFILGTTGEFAHISMKLREQLIQRVCTQVNGRAKVLVGISDTSVTQSQLLAQKAADHGADALVATPPYYYMQSQSEVAHHFVSLADRVPLPLFLYNMPVHTKVQVEPATVKQIFETSKNIIGLKDSSANMSYLRAVQFLMKDQDFPIFIGPEEMTADGVLLGAAGGVNGGANMFPKLYVAQYETSINRDFDRLEIIRDKVLEISSLIYPVGKYGASSYLQGLKSALSVLGLCDDYLPEPFQRLDLEGRKRIEMNLEKLEMAEFNRKYLD